MNMVEDFQKGKFKIGYTFNQAINLSKEIFLRFLGVNERLKNNPTLYDYSFINKINMLIKYGLRYF